MLRGHTNNVLSVAKFNETTIFSGISDNTVRVWDLGSKSCVAVLRGHTDDVNSVAFQCSFKNDELKPDGENLFLLSTAIHSV